MTDKKRFIITVLFLLFAPALVCPAVTSKATHHTSSQDFLKGETNDVVIGSRGTIGLGRRAEVLVKQFEDVWSINSIVVSGDTVYVGTSPNGGVYAFGPGGLKKIYSAAAGKPQRRDSNDSDSNEPNVVKSEKHMANEHIFAMATDVSGRLLVGISGQKCALYRLEAGQMKVIFEPNDANYIFSIAVDKTGDIFLGTGPHGKVYRLDSLGNAPEVIYDSPDKNILSLTQGPDSLIYAGSDGRGIIYSINPRTRDIKVLYDSEQQEITALLFDGDDLYAAATSANVVQAETRFASQPPQAGRPESRSQDDEPGGDTADGMKLQIANTKEPAGEQPAERKGPPQRPPRPTQNSYVYKVTKDGFVTDIFSEQAVFFCLAESRNQLLVGTGNTAQLFSIDPNSEEETMIYEDRQTSQLTAVVASGDDVYAGMANPARLIKLGRAFARQGTYLSEPVDAGQPAKWGKLQIEADIPADCNVLAASRSGNVKDPNDPSFSKWTELEKVTGPMQLNCPVGRFCQYKLVLEGNDSGKASPVIREVAVAQTVPNLAPRVESVNVSRIEAPPKQGVFKIVSDAKDDNADKLIFKIDFRKAGRTGWIEIAHDVELSNFEWDGRTVEDGRYEIRVTASDERSNTPETRLTGSRVSRTVVVDNTGPEIKNYAMDKTDGIVTLKMTVSDELSAIGKVEYTVDSDANWMGVVPDDLVYDTTSENFTILTEKLAQGQHVIALRLADDVSNMTYKTFDIAIEKK